MSGRTRKNGERAKLDAYYTDDRVAQAVIDEVIPHILMAEAAPLRVLEPHVGGGAWVRALQRLRSPNITITAMDLNPEAAGLALADHAMPGVDFLELAKGWSSNDVRWDLVKYEVLASCPLEILGLAAVFERGPRPNAGKLCPEAPKTW